MKLTNKQAIIMFDILKWCLSVSGGVVGYSNQQLHKMAEEIINQQSDVLIELGE